MKNIIFKIKLFLNSTLLMFKPISWLIINTKYHDEILRINNKYHEQGSLIPLKEMKSAIINHYYKSTFSKRFFLIDVIIATKYVKNAFPISKEKEQGRNEKCNCNSGKKYKHCCFLKNKI